MSKLVNRTQGTRPAVSSLKNPFVPCKPKEAKQIILDLIDAGHENALSGIQDGGVNVDIVFSRIKGHGSEVMTQAEAEARTDAAIRQAYKAITGKEVTGDPVDFINS